MDNKLSELSKPAWIVGEKEIADFMSGDEALLVRGHDPESTEPALRMYSQEYVSALLAELEAKDKRIAEMERSLTDAGRERDDWVDHSSKMERRAIEAERKLATPIVAPDDGFDDCREMRPDSTNDFDTGYNFGLYRYEQNIRAAGFTVEGDE